MQWGNFDSADVLNFRLVSGLLITNITEESDLKLLPTSSIQYTKIGLSFLQPNPQEVFWPLPSRYYNLDLLMNEHTSLLLQISEYTYGKSNQLFRSIRSVYLHRSWLLSFYYFLSKSHSVHILCLPCSTNWK